MSPAEPKKPILPPLSDEATGVLEAAFSESLKPGFNVLAKDLIETVDTKIEQYHSEILRLSEEYKGKLLEKANSLNMTMISELGNQFKKLKSIEDLTGTVKSDTEQFAQEVSTQLEELKSEFVRMMKLEAVHQKKMTILFAMALGILSLSQICVILWLLLG